MKRFNNKIQDYGYLLYRWINPFIDPIRFAKAFPGYIEFFKEWGDYSQLKSSENIKVINTYPCVLDRTKITSFDSHYFYQDIWAFKKIYRSKVPKHFDVGSRIELIGFLTAITNVTFIDIRPLNAELENFNSKKGNILSLPFEDNSINSISCLHVAEHIGLGRYGDTLDPLGTKKACKELSRVLAPGGNLYFSLPVGKPRLCFNAHRIHTPKEIIDKFYNLKLIELSGIDDDGKFIKNIERSILEQSYYACGLFHFIKKKENNK